jgi:hypothetical protein
MLKDNLVAFWNMGQDPALYPIHDRSHNQNHLTGVNFSPDLTPPGSLVDGKLGKAIEFDGISQYLTIASNAGFSHQGNPFTVLVWFKPVALAHQKIIATTTEWGIQTVLSGGNFYINVAIEDEEVTVTDVPLVVGEWYFIVLGYKDDPTPGPFIWASVNLSARVTELQNGLTPSPGPFSMGGSAASGWISGVIDDTAFFRRELSATEIMQVYNGGDGLAFEQWDKVKPCRSITCCP